MTSEMMPSPQNRSVSERFPIDLTRGEGLIKDAPTVESRPGYALVVYQETSRGRRLESILKPGVLFKPSPVKPWAKYYGFLVSLHRGRRICWEVEAQSGDQLHDYILKFELQYQVQSPRVLIESQDNDPLRRLQEGTERVILQRSREIPWRLIKQGGHVLDQAIGLLPAEAPPNAFDEIDRIAARFGFEVDGFTVNRHLLDRELEEERARQEVQRKQALFEIKLEDNRQETTLKALSSVNELTETLQSMMQRAGQGVDNFPDMQRAIHDLAEIRSSLERLVQPIQASQWTEVDAGHRLDGISPQRSFAPPSITSPLTQLLLELANQLQRTPEAVRHEIASIVCHLVAEVLEEEMRDVEINHYRERIQHLLTHRFDELKLDNDQVALLRRLHDTDELRRDLWSR